MRSLVPFACLAAITGAVILAAAAAGLRGRGGVDATAYSVERSSNPGGFPRVLTAPDETAVELAAPPRRLIAISLALEEMVAELAGMEALVAVSDKARDPGLSHIAAAAAGIPATIRGSNAEAIVRLGPDLVLISSYTDPRARSVLERCGVPVFPLPEPAGFGSIRDTALLLGDLLGCEQRAARLIAAMDERLEAVRRRIPPGPRPRVLHFYEYVGFWVAGSGTSIGEIIELAGGANAAAEGGVRGSQKLGREVILRWDPDWLLLEGEEGLHEAIFERLEADPALRELPAVRRRRVIILPSRTLGSVSHHAIDAVERLNRAIHGDP